MTVEKRFLRGILGLCLLSICCSTQKAQYGSGLAKVPPSGNAARFEKEMLVRLNSDRKRQGLHALKWDPDLASIARYHSRDMKQNDFFGHTSPTTGNLDNRLVRAAYLAEVARENVAIAPNVQIGQDSLLQSPGHRANIYSQDVTHVGIGIVVGSSKEPGSLTITQVFSKPMRAESPGEAKATIARRIDQERRKRGLPPLRKDSGLNSLAQQNLRALDGNVTRGDLKRVGEAVEKSYARKNRSANGAIVTIAQNLVSGGDLQISGALTSPGASRYGLAVKKVRDERGRPLLVVLLVLFLSPQ